MSVRLDKLLLPNFQITDRKLEFLRGVIQGIEDWTEDVRIEANSSYGPFGSQLQEGLRFRITTTGGMAYPNVTFAAAGDAVDLRHDLGRVPEWAWIVHQPTASAGVLAWPGPWWDDDDLAHWTDTNIRLRFALADGFYKGFVV